MNKVESATLSVHETATYLGVGRNTTYALVKAKEIPALRIGRQIRIPKAALDEWMLKQSCS